jgi:hypothetical protein
MPQNALNLVKSLTLSTKNILMGTSTTPVTDSLNGNSIIAIYVNPTATDGPNKYETCLVESLIGATTAFTQQGFGVYAGCFRGGVATGVTLKGVTHQAYIAGCQAKLTNNGVIGDGNSGGIYACAGLSQTEGAGTWGADAQFYGHWIDVQSTVTSLPATAHLLNMTNNSAATILNAMMIYGNSGKITNFAEIDSCAGSGFVKTITGNASHQTLGLKVVVDGVTYYVPLQSAIN